MQAPGLILSLGQLVVVPGHLSCINYAHNAPKMICNVGFIKID